jgi:nucleoid-associated protein YgaU
MTSDAKIGLLLGLVFIFIIAFIINGLPNLRPQSTKAEVAANVPDVGSENLGLADNEQKAQEVLNWAELMDRQGNDLQSFEPVLEEPEVAGTASEPPIDESATTVMADGSAEDVRSILPLPSPETVERVARGIGDIIEGLTKEPRPAAALETMTERAPVIEAPEPAPQRIEPTPARASTPARPSSPQLRLPKVYEVVDGDNLASVAKKVYGPEEGNKRANIQRIFEANRNVLSAPDQIFVGQKLVIPPLPATPDGPAKVLPKALFKQVESVGREQLAGLGSTPSEGRYYVVQEGDSLWKIASTQLGSGARHEEITKLNADILEGKDVLDVGTRLRLPSK